MKISIINIINYYKNIINIYYNHLLSLKFELLELRM